MNGHATSDLYKVCGLSLFVGAWFGGLVVYVYGAVFG